MSQLIALMQKGFDPFGAVMRGDQARRQNQLSDLIMQQKQQEMQWANQDRESAVTANKEALRQKVLGNAFKALNDPQMTPPEKRAEAWQAVNQQLQSKFGFGLGSDQYSDDAMRGLGIETGSLSGADKDYSKSAQIGRNPQTGKLEYIQFAADGSQRFTGVEAAPRLEEMKLPDGRTVFFDTVSQQIIQPGSAPQPQNQGSASPAPSQPDGAPPKKPSDIFDEAERRAIAQREAEAAAASRGKIKGERDAASENPTKIKAMQSAISNMRDLLATGEPIFGKWASKVPDIAAPQSWVDARRKLDNVKAVLTSENLGIMSGVLSESDMKIIQAISAGNLQEDMSWEEVAKALESGIAALKSQIGGDGQIGQAQQTQGTYQSSRGVQFRVVQP